MATKETDFVEPESPPPPPLTRFKYSNRVQLKTLLERRDGDGGRELVGQKVVVGGWVKTSKEVEKLLPIPPTNLATDEKETKPKKDVSCVEILQSRIPLIRNLLDVFVGSGYAHRKKRESVTTDKPLPLPPPPPPKAFTAYLNLSDGSCVASLQVISFPSATLFSFLFFLHFDLKLP